MTILKNIYKWFIATRLRKILSFILTILILLTSIRFLFLKPKEVLADSLVGFNEGYGTTVSDNNGLISGTITNALWREESLCKFGKCLYFDGTGDYVDFGNDSDVDFTTGSFTIEGWFRTPDISSGTRVLVAKYNAATGTDGGYKVYMDSNGYLIFGIDNDQTSFPSDSASTSTTAFDDNKWHHFAAVKNGTTSISIYVDGVLYQTDSSITASSLTNTDNFYVGIDGDGSSNGYTGFLDEIKVYSSSARSQAEINADVLGSTPDRGVSASFGPDQSYLSDGLVGYWKLDEGSGDASDLSGNITTLTNVSTTTYSQAKFGNGMEPDGTADYLQAADSAALSQTGSITLAAWIQPDDTTGSQDIIAKWDGSNESYLLAMEGANLRMYVDSSSNYEASTATPITANVFQHVAGVYDSTSQTVKLYVNGAVVASSTTGTIPSSIGDDAGQFQLGAEDHNNTPSNFYDGHIDEARIYSRALSPAEVSKLYDWAPGPVGYWKLDENTGTSSVNDSSGEENSATMTGTMTSNDWVPGKFGSALDFDGSDDALTIATASDTDLDFNGTEAFSAGAWVYVKTMPGSGEQDAIITKWDETSTTRGYRLFVENDDADTTGNFQVDIYDESADQTISATGSIDTISANTWYHVFFTFNGGTAGAAADLNLYTNAVFTNSNSLNASFVGLEDVTADFSVGDYDTTDAVSTNTAFTGIIDNLQIYNYVRSQAQIVEDMNAGHPAPGSPVGSATSYWKFDTGYGTTAYDASVNANNLTLSTATSAWTASGKFNKAWDGNGTRYASRSNDDDFDVGTENFSFSFWFKSDNSGGSGTQYIINRASSTIQGFAIYGNSSGNIVFAIDDDTTWTPDSTATSTANLYDQAWHHIIAIKTGTSKMELFVDGKLDATNSSIATGSLSNDLTFYIGDRDATDNGDEFIGDVDEVKFYRLALNSDQIKLEYNRGSAQLLGATSTDSTGNASWSSANEYCPPRSSGTCTPPVAEWRMDENTGNILQDSSGNGYTSSAFTGNTKYISGIFGSGLLFDGDNDVVRITPAGSSYLDTIGAVGNSYTVSGWFKTTNTNTSLTNTVVGKDKDNSGVFPFRLYISTSPKELQFVINDGSACLASGSSIAVNDGNWHLATGVFNASTGFAYVYIDSMLIGISSSCGTNNSSANTDDISIGNARASLDGDYTNDDFEGSIDMVRIYDYARTPAEIAWEYGHGKPSVGWWKLDDNVSGNAQTIRDSASFAKDGTTANNSTNLSCTGSGKINLACDFDGTDDSISMGSGLSKLTIAVGDSRDFSITGWFNRDTITTDDTIISQRATVTNGNQGWAIWIGGTSDALTFEGCDANVNCDEYMIETTSTFISTGWHHFALIWDDDNESNVIFYVDGKPESVTRTCNTSGSPVSCTLSNIGSLTVNTRNFRIGSLHGGTSTDMPFDGKIDDIRFYSHALNALDIKNLFNQGSGVRFGPESGTP